MYITQGSRQLSGEVQGSRHRAAPGSPVSLYQVCSAMGEPWLNHARLILCPTPMLQFVSV